MWFFALLAMLGVAGMGYYWFLRRWLDGRGWSFQYLLYASTPLGLRWHAREVAKSRGKPSHSKPLGRFHFPGGVEVHVVPYLSDNLAYVIIDGESGKMAVVDPGDAVAVDDALRVLTEDDANKTSKSLEYILATHKHADHSGGNEELAKAIHARTNCSPIIVGFDGESVAGESQAVRSGDIIRVGQARLRVLHVPGHTRGSVAYLLLRKESEVDFVDAVFTGDCLFQAGAGKFFEGGAHDMVESFQALAQNTRDESMVFPGHEYTVSNLEFAVFVDDAQIEAKERLEWARAKRLAHESTIPSTMKQEKTFNPFMRVVLTPNTGAEGGRDRLIANLVTLADTHAPRVQSGSDRGEFGDDPVAIVDRRDPVQAMRALRALKDMGLNKLKSVVKI